MGSLVPTASPSLASGTPTEPNVVLTPNASVQPLAGGPSVAAILSSPAAARGVTESTAAAVSSLVANSVNSVKEDDNNTFPVRGASPAIPEIGMGRGINRGISNQASVTASMSLVSGISNSGGLGSLPAVPDLPKRNVSTGDERMGSGGLTSPSASPLSNRMFIQQFSKNNDGTISNDANSTGESPIIGGRVFSPTIAAGVPWRPQSSVAFPSQNETVCFSLSFSCSLHLSNVKNQ